MCHETLNSADGERTYYCQNHRGDIVQLIWSTPWGVRRCEAVRYSAFGIPTVIASGDFDGDGDEDSTDWQSLEDLLLQRPVPYIVTYDMDLDGDVDETDSELQFLTSGGGRGLLSTGAVANRRGYAGYEHDWAIESLCHVRHRAYLTELGRWTRRDPLGYVEGISLYAYVANRAVVRTDAMGLRPTDPDGGNPRPFDPGATDPDWDPKKPGNSHPSPGSQTPECDQWGCIYFECDLQSDAGSPCDNCGTSFGYIRCDGGLKKCCVCDLNIDEYADSADGFDIQFGCTLFHELVHLHDPNLHCPATPLEISDSECLAWKATKTCLEDGVKHCRSKRCRDQVIERTRFAEGRIKFYCPGVTIP